MKDIITPREFVTFLQDVFTPESLADVGRMLVVLSVVPGAIMMFAFFTGDKKTTAKWAMLCLVLSTMGLLLWTIDSQS